MQVTSSSLQNESTTVIDQCCFGGLQISGNVVAGSLREKESRTGGSSIGRGVTQVQKIRSRNYKPQVQEAPAKLVKPGSVSHETRCARSLSIKKKSCRMPSHSAALEAIYQAY